MRVLAGGLLLACFSAAPAVAQDAVQPTGPVEKVQGDFAFTEGPAWSPEGILYFTDIPQNTIFQMEPDGKISTFVEPSGHANGLLIGKQGRLLACQMDGQLVAYDRDSQAVTVLAATYQGKRFNAPNDLVQDGEGGIYFTDPLFRAPEPLPQGVQAVYYLPPDGKVQRVTGGLPAPNGIGLSPAGKRLYVIPSRSSEMLVYPVEAPGKLGEADVFCHLQQPTGKENTGGDGMAMDQRGNLYITSGIGVQIFDPEGTMLGNIEFPEQPANVTFGGPAGKTLYVTARQGLYRVAMPIAGWQGAETSPRKP